MIFKPWITKELTDKEFYNVITALRGPDNSVVSLHIKHYTTAYLRWLVFSTPQKSSFYDSYYGGTINANATLGATKLVEVIKESTVYIKRDKQNNGLRHFLYHTKAGFDALSNHLEYIPKGHKNKVKALARDDTYNLEY